MQIKSVFRIRRQWFRCHVGHDVVLGSMLTLGVAWILALGEMNYAAEVEHRKESLLSNLGLDLRVLDARQDEPPKVPPSAKLQAHDRLTLVGGTMVERLQTDGRLEAALYHSLNSQQFQIRNLGWSGDDVWGTARAVFGQASDGFERLRADLQFTQPTVVVVAYGANESFAGAEGLESFVRGLERLLLMVKESGARPLLVTPPPFEDLGSPMPSMQIANENLAIYCRAIREIAAQQNLELIDLHQRVLATARPSESRTYNGVHMTPAGTAEVSRILAEEMLGQKIADKHWDQLNQAENLLGMIRRKNEWYFHRYRPQNETYLFLFRKHEQGNNAVEIPQFDELVNRAEQDVRREASNLPLK
ncbi:MAG: SGNH/GDSL hydrolase family protein [Planctomycetaceae bacterium]|nr:SGNH/GDSL hydrolase family protein [Planctomycetaceae bacterium]